jgi:hypothetical protein
MTDKIVSYVADLHIVRINEEDFDIQHPLSERETMFLVDCPLHLWMKGLDGPPAKVGMYRVHQRPDEHWVFDPMDDDN